MKYASLFTERPDCQELSDLKLLQIALLSADKKADYVSQQIIKLGLRLLKEIKECLAVNFFFALRLA